MPSSTGNDNNCFTPWPDMGQAMRVYSVDGPSPTIAMHAVLVLHGKEGEVNDAPEDDEVMSFTVTGNDFSTGLGVSPTIRAGSDRQNTTPMVVVPIQDGREMDKKQNGLGVGDVGDPMYTLDTTGAQAVCYEIPAEPPYLIDGRREGDFRVFEGTAPALMARMGTGGNNVPVVVAEGVWWNGSEVADTLTVTSDAQRMPDKGRFQAVVQVIPDED